MFSPFFRYACLSATAPLALATATPALLAQDTVPPGAHVGDVPTQLPVNARPTHYALSVTPDAAKLSFTGRVAIDLDLLEPSSSLTLNAADLDISSADISAIGGKAITPKVSINPDAQTATFTFPRSLAPGKYRLNIAYSGKIYTQAAGLFALDYEIGGEKKRALFTQFEAPDARRFVPSWDEPLYKATFDLTAIVPADQLAISNMPIKSRQKVGNSRVAVTFATTPKMSSYLLFFGVGELERTAMMAGKTEVGIVTGKGNADKAQYALKAAAEILPFYNDYFGIDFPLPKLDNVAGPGQSQFFSAMENWGAIFSFERVLLDDPKITTEADKQRIYVVLAHEMAHQWFGDLVTMAWWDDLWLNEGFASWMESKTTAHFNPEWHVELDKVDSKEAARSLDAFVTTHPVIQKIQTVEQTSQAFDAITYQKGEAVITMLEGFAGEDVWRSGIRQYMKDYAYHNTVTDDLWTAVEKAGAKGVTQIAHDFTLQPGIPLIEVKKAACENGMTKLSLSQGEFTRDRKNKTPLMWHVPVIARIAGQTESRAIIADGSGNMTLAGCGPLIVNAGQSGYYRVLYDETTLSALKGNFTALEPIDQLGLLGDNFAMAYADRQPISKALDLLDAVPGDAQPKLLNAVSDYLYGLYSTFDGDPPLQTKIAAFATTRLEPALRRLGFAPAAGESSENAILRSNLLINLGAMGNSMVLETANERFAQLDHDRSALDGPLRTTWLNVTARHADQATWNKLRAMANAAPSQLEKSSLFSLLGAAYDKALAQKALDLALTDEPGATNSAALISRVSSRYPDMAVDFALAHLPEVEKLVDTSSRSRYVARLAGGSKDKAMLDKLDAYATAHLTPESRKPIDQAIARIRESIATRTRIKADVERWFAGERK
ncbi:M1 family metallopeptidase [Rhizorhapis sp. SPR117]|uniref:M1 family metallopeptidase n=1 Tax=Rhizorhapis sp. SPR117 TaxID=2912611 RepID=UPI001F25F975|nr:M1 family metallopeptidase [Rhizorhapis sp. SPR117]